MIQRHITMEVGQLCCIIPKIQYRSLQFISVKTNLLFMWIKQNQNQINPGERMERFVGQWMWVQLIGWIENRAARLCLDELSGLLTQVGMWHTWQKGNLENTVMTDMHILDVSINYCLLNPRSKLQQDLGRLSPLIKIWIHGLVTSTHALMYPF